MKSVKNKPQKKKSNQVSDLKKDSNSSNKLELNQSLIDNKTKQSFNVNRPKPFYYGKHHPPLTISNAKEIIKELQIKPARMRLVCMFNLAGRPELFTVDSTKTNFTYLNGTYIIPQEDDPVEINSGYQLTFYHQSLSSPISFRIPVEKLQDMLDDDENVEVGGRKYNIDYAINPELVRKFMLSKIIEKTMQGQDMQDIFTMLKRLSIIILCVVGAILIILLQYTGLLNNLPFL